MTKEHCMIDGKRCTKCCEVLGLSCYNKNLREKFSYFRRNPEKVSSKEQQVFTMLRKISKRRAKKKNSYMVKRFTRNGVNGQSFFTCKHFKNGKCNNYENRPTMCSGYPYYGQTEEEFKKSKTYPVAGEYRIDCTFYG